MPDTEVSWTHLVNVATAMEAAHQGTKELLRASDATRNAGVPWQREAGRTANRGQAPPRTSFEDMVKSGRSAPLKTGGLVKPKQHIA